MLKQAHAHFLRFRKPATERIRELVIKTVPNVKDITYTIEGVQLYDTARKAFDNMRHDFMKGTRALTTTFEQQIGDNDIDEIPSVKDIVTYLKDEHIQRCFKLTMAVIDHSFLDTIPQGSDFGTARTFMLNLIALAIRVHLEVKYEITTKDKAAAYIYSVDSSTDSNAWVPPLSPYVGPAGSRGKCKPTTVLPKRTFEFVKDDGSVIPFEIGGLY